MQHKLSIRLKYLFSVAGLVSAVLIVTGAIEMWFAFSENKTRMTIVQAAAARESAVRIVSFLETVERHMADVNSLPWDSGLLTIADRQGEFHRLLKIVPAITEIQQLDAAYREQLFVSRIDVDRLNEQSVTDVGKFSSTSTSKILSYGSVYFKNTLEPHVKLFVRASTPNSGFTILEINLKFVANVIATEPNLRQGLVYVVDKTRHLISHPDLNLVLRQTDLSTFSPVKALPANQTLLSLYDGPGFSNRRCLTSAAPIQNANWWVFVEQPYSVALEPVFSTLYRTALLLILSLFFAAVISLALTRKLTSPILKLRFGAQQYGLGELGSRIDVQTGDELQDLAHEFNNMAAQLQDYTQNLEQKVADKTHQLELANKHKSEFLANMSHELRTPLNAVIGFSDALREEYFGALNDKQREYVNDIALSGQHLLSLINDILDLSKIESGMMDLSCTHFSVASAIDNAMVLIRERAIRQEVTVTSEIGEGVDLLYADERKFKQVLINLLTNAVKFTYPNGWVKIRSVIEGKDLLVSVADSGMGIAAEDFETVFQEFRQLTTVGEATHEGTGLGLPLAKRIVELHGGRIWLESELGKGATFWFVVPLGTSDDVDLMKVQ